MTRPIFRAAFLLLMLAGFRLAQAGSMEGPSGEAGEAPVEPIPNLPIDSIRAPKVNSVPYPNGAMYLHRGITGTFMGGKRGLSHEKNFLFQWQGELSYFYTSWFSGGMGFRIVAGEPNSEKQKIVNRYFAQARFHKAWDKVAVFVGPQIGVGNINISFDSLASSHGVDPITETKPTFSLDFGGGWKFSRYMGATLGSNLEYSMVDEDRNGLNNTLNLHAIPGLSLDVLALAESLRALVPAFYVHTEAQFGLLLSEATGQKNDVSYLLGVGLAF